MIADHDSDAALDGRVVRKCLRATALWFLGAGVLMAPSLGAQATISGTVVEAETGAPVQGASVILLSRSGDEVGWRLTDATGRFDFRPIPAGTYSLRADRIGLASVLSDRIAVEEGASIVHRLEAPVEAIMLAGIEVESSRRCEVRPGQGVSTATVWEEARKALAATSRTSRLRVYRFTVRRYERELDARGRRARSEHSRFLRGQVQTRPFRSLAVENLIENGFMRPDAEGGTYYAPDADVLLSDAFLDTHCMSLTEGEDEAEGLLGLSFEPTEDRGVPDISGVLWLDPEDAKLQWLDFRYEFLDVPNSERLGGKIRFDDLPDGRWIVGEWYVLMPHIEVTVERGREDRRRLVGIREEGGLVVRVSTLQGDLVLEPQGSDRVQDLVATLDDGGGVTPGDDGRIRVTSMAAGNTSSRVFYPTEDCSQDELPVGFRYAGILTGFALHENGEPAPGAGISLAWEEIEREGAGFVRVPKTLSTVALGPDGFFLVCGVPRDRAVDITEEWNGITSEPVQFQLLETERVSRRDVTVPRAL